MNPKPIAGRLPQRRDVSLIEIGWRSEQGAARAWIIRHTPQPPGARPERSPHARNRAAGDYSVCRLCAGRTAHCPDRPGDGPGLTPPELAPTPASPGLHGIARSESELLPGVLPARPAAGLFGSALAPPSW